MMKKRFILSFATAIMTAALLTGCGLSGLLGKDDQPQPAQPETTVTDETDTVEDSSSEKPEIQGSTTPGFAKASPLEDMVGSWVCICTVYTTEYDSGEYYSSSVMICDDYSPQSAIKVRKDGDSYIADYKLENYESECRIYGSVLDLKREAAYRDCANKDWCAVLDDPFKSMESVDRKLTMDGDKLIEVEEEFHEGTDDEYDEAYYFYTVRYYLPENSPLLNDPEELRYFDTVTVSNEAELMDSIRNNRKILLEGGHYDLTSLPMRDIDNPRITMDYEGYTVNDVYNLCLEAKDGADVLISVDEPYYDVLHLTDCGNIRFKGLTLGHDVEPGYCSGSVIGISSSSDIGIEDCNLFGSGTYGIEASYSYGINVRDTDIYECTYGLLYLEGTSAATFSDCLFRDSSGFSMISLYSGGDVLFEDCTFSGNASSYGDDDFVSSDEYSTVAFRNCDFSNNRYGDFSDREVSLENCTMDGEAMSYDTLNPYTSADGILKQFGKVRDRQKEIDDIFYEGMADQQTQNQLAYEEYAIWDSLLNGIWGYLEENLEAKEMEALRTEQKEWIRKKESEVQTAKEQFEGGTMVPMIQYGTGARITRERVEVLIHKYFEE